MGQFLFLGFAQEQAVCLNDVRAIPVVVFQATQSIGLAALPRLMVFGVFHKIPDP